MILVTATATTSAVDLVDEVVVPDGCQVRSDGQPVYLSDAKAIYLSHDYASLPIGTFRSAKITRDGWVAQFVIHGQTALSRDIQALFMLGDDNPVRGVSIGFNRIDAGRPTQAEIEEYGPCSYVTRTWKWMELSVTPQPCNPEAWVTMAQTGKSVADPKTADALDRLACKGTIRKETARLLGLDKPEKKPRRVLLIPRGPGVY